MLDPVTCAAMAIGRAATSIVPAISTRFGVLLLLGLPIALLASFMISYASAKAEALSVTTPRGLMRRHERAVFSIDISFNPRLG